MLEEEILEPLAQYPTLKSKVEEEAKALFDSLSKDSGVDIEANKATCKEYYQKKNDLSAEQNALSSLKSKKGLLLAIGIILIVVGAIAIFVGIMQKQTLSIILFVVCGLLAILGGILILALPYRKFGQKVLLKEKEIREKDKTAEEIKQKAYQQMAALNERFDDGLASKVISKAIPIIQMDPHLDASKLHFLIEHYAFSAQPEKNTSIVDCQSGSIVGNPFLIVKQKDMEMGNETYTGSIVISWVTYERDSEGHSHAVHHSETLMASVRKPKPFYHYETYLLFGSDAAPKLNFSRRPTVDRDSNDKSLEKQVKKTNKNLEKLAKESMNDADPHDLTLMGNREFEALWGGNDRNNEVEYRLLFTPLAQNNLLSLIKSKQPYGDDFMFKKRGRCNLVASYHSQGFDYSQNGKRFIGFDFEEMEKNFQNYIGEYFLHFYFDLAPILSIPIYQQTKPFEYIFKSQYGANYSFYEHEVIANLYDPEYFKPKECETDIILSDIGCKKEGKLDEVNILAQGYKTLRRVEYVSELGGDGHMHAVPVPYLEYIPVSKTSHLGISPMKVSRYQYQQKIQEASFNEKSKSAKAKLLLHHRNLLSFFLEETDEDSLKDFADYLEDISK